MQNIGIEGQWILGIGLEYKDSVIDDESLGTLVTSDLKQFFIVEETGNLLPTYKITFISSDKWAKYWNENSKLLLTLGMEQSGAKVLNTKVNILSKDIKDLGSGTYLYYASGTYDASVFPNTPHIRTLGPASGTSVIEQIVKPHFKETEITGSSNESMPWFQMNTSDKKFADYIISHSYMPKSFPTCGITMNGTYLLVDTVRQCSKSPEYVIGEDIQLIDIPKLVSNSGFYNSQGVYGLDLPISSGEFGVSTTGRIDIDLGLVSAKPSKVSNVERRTLAPSYFNSCNVTEFYNVAKASYNYGQALLSMEQMIIKALDMKTPIQVLDIVDVIDPISNSNQQTYQDVSGKYMVSKVIRGISNNIAVLKVVLGRNAHNEQ